MSYIRLIVPHTCIILMLKCKQQPSIVPKLLNRLEILNKLIKVSHIYYFLSFYLIQNILSPLYLICPFLLPPLMLFYIFLAIFCSLNLNQLMFLTSGLINLLCTCSNRLKQLSLIFSSIRYSYF